MFLYLELDFLMLGYHVLGQKFTRLELLIAIKTFPDLFLLVLLQLLSLTNKHFYLLTQNTHVISDLASLLDPLLRLLLNLLKNSLNVLQLLIISFNP